MPNPASVNFAYHDQLTASTNFVVNLARANGTIEVINRDGSAEIRFTVDGTTVTSATQVDTYVVPAAMGSYPVVVGSGAVTVNLWSTGTPKFSVIGGQAP